ncbi:MAG: DUF1549 domain-containing protein, partial [Verrucomicrobiota bacterium]|nr:DUF1549 domain-containing protein [Verrucomicrobiota bacterium]
MNCWINTFAFIALVMTGCAAPQNETLHWAFRPIGNPKSPHVEKLDWVKNPIDRFVLAKLESNGLSPAQRATEHILNRRAHFILTGLPPSLKSKS